MCTEINFSANISFSQQAFVSRRQSSRQGNELYMFSDLGHFLHSLHKVANACWLWLSDWANYRLRVPIMASVVVIISILSQTSFMSWLCSVKHVMNMYFPML